MTHDSNAFRRAAKRVPVSARRYAAENAERIAAERDELDLSWDQVATALYRMRAIGKPVKGAVLAHYVRDALTAAGVERAPRSERAARETRFGQRDDHPLRREAAPARQAEDVAVAAERSAALSKLAEIVKPKPVRTHDELRREVAEGKVAPLPAKPASEPSTITSTYAAARTAREKADAVAHQPIADIADLADPDDPASVEAAAPAAAAAAAPDAPVPEAESAAAEPADGATGGADAAPPPAAKPKVKIPNLM